MGSDFLVNTITEHRPPSGAKVTETKHHHSLLLLLM